jgi:hypothetical protein
MLQEFANVFTQAMNLPLPHFIKDTIDLILGASFPNAPSYPLSHRDFGEIECQIGQLLDSSHIQPSLSPCASPSFIIPQKKTFEWCLVADYHSLNKYIVKNH